jgi:hypothetical protein
MTRRRIKANAERHAEITRKIEDVGRMFDAFRYKGELHLSHAVVKTMKEAETELAAGDLDRVEHLLAVVAFMIKREAPRFAVDPEKWIKMREGLHA